MCNLISDRESRGIIVFPLSRPIGKVESGIFKKNATYYRAVREARMRAYCRLGECIDCIIVSVSPGAILGYGECCWASC